MNKQVIKLIKQIIVALWREMSSFVTTDFLACLRMQVQLIDYFDSNEYNRLMRFVARRKSHLRDLNLFRE